MIKRAILFLSAIIISCSASVKADVLTLTRVSGNTINIDGKVLKAGDSFNDGASINWTNNSQMIEAKNKATGGIFRFSARQFNTKKGVKSVKDFFLRTNKASSRNSLGADVCFVPSSTKSSFPDKRIALVIANTNYTNLTSLRNPIYDAQNISDALSKLGFDVYEGYDCDYTDMVSALNNFAAKSKDYDVALFYYSGHGIQEGGHNYLVPVSANLEFKSSLDRCIDAYDVLERMENSGAKSRIVCLDACRDVKTSWTRSASRGLTTMEGAPGTAIVCSTRSGQVALDGETDNSPFAASFINALAEKGKNFSELMSNVGKATYQATDSKQCPIVSGMLLDDFVFNPTGAQITPVSAKAATAAAPATTVAKASPAASTAVATTTAAATSAPKAVVASNVSVQCDVPDFQVRVSPGKRIGNNVWVDVVFVNGGPKSKTFGFCGKEPCAGYDDYMTAAWDDNGDSYELDRGGIFVLKGDERMYNLEITAPSGVPVKYRLKINDVPASVRSFPMLSIAFRGLMPGESYGQAVVKVRNLPVQ